MLRTVRAATLGLLFALGSVPAEAQTFQGLDTTKPPPKKKKKSTKSSTSATKSTAPTPAAAPAPSGAATTTAPAAAPTAAPAGSEPALGVDTTQPTPVKPKSAKDLPMPPPPGAGASKKTAPTTSFEALDVTGKTADRQRLEAANAQFLAKEYDKAGLAAWDLMNDPKMAPLHLESQYLLGKTLYRMGLYHSALGEFSQILARGEQTRFFSKSLEWLFFISHKTTNESIILDEVARYANAEWPEKYRSEFYYLLARYEFVRGRALEQVDQKAEAQKSYQEALRLAGKVPRNDPFFVRTKFLEGVIQSRSGNQAAALEALKEVVRLTRAPADVKGNEMVRDLAFMDLARIHYAARQNRYAIYYYGKIERGRPEWLEALFESAWANYRIGQYQQALGNLVTLSSPFFRDEYFPEALLLKAVVYYENCRYRESTAIIQDFDRRYKPVYEQLDTLVKKDMEATEYYQVLADIQKKVKAGQAGGTGAILERVLKLALTDRELKNTNDSILEVEKEMDLIAARPTAFRTSELARHLDDGLKKERQDLVKRAGVMARGKLELELGNLRTLLGNAERIKFETTGKEKEFLEEQLQAGGRKAIVKQYRYSVAVADDQLYWPFTGEYWRDELGTYEYTLTKGCVDRSAGNRKVTGAQ